MTKLSDLLGGCGGGPTELGSSHSSGTGNATIVTSGANVSGVELRTVSLVSANALVSLKIGGNVILRATANSSNSITNIIAPAGAQVEVEFGLNPSGNTGYQITYEVL